MKVFTIVTLVFMFLRPIIFFFVAKSRSIHLHNEMIKSVIYTNYNFFVKNTIGDIKNHFSYDLLTIDEDLPYKIFCFFQVNLLPSDILINRNSKPVFLFYKIFALVIGIFILTIYVNFIMIVPIIALSSFLAIFRNRYSRILRNLKRLETDCDFLN
jgi:hypothetical protein